MQPERKGKREKSEWQIERMLDEASRLANRAAAAANPSTHRIPAHLQNRDILSKPSSSSAIASRHSMPRKGVLDGPAHAAFDGGAHAGTDARRDRVPRDEREAKKLEMDRFQSLLLSLDVSLNNSKKGSSAQKEQQGTLKGRFASNQDYVDTFGPLVMEEIRAELLQERVEQGPSCFRPAALRDLQPSPQSADFQYFTLALDMSDAVGGREYYENGDCIVVQTKVVAWQKSLQDGAAQPTSPLTQKAIDFMAAANFAGSSGREGEVTRFKGGLKSKFEGESSNTPPGSSVGGPRLEWGQKAHDGKGGEGRDRQDREGSGSHGRGPVQDAQGEWVLRGRPLEFLAIVVNAKKEACASGAQVGNLARSVMVLRLRAARSLDLDKRVGGGSSVHAGEKSRNGVAWKAMRLKHVGSSIREWRAVGAVREAGGSKKFGRVIARDLLQDILRPPPGCLPTSQQVEGLRASSNACGRPARFPSAETESGSWRREKGEAIGEEQVGKVEGLMQCACLQVESVFAALNPAVAQHITDRCNPSQQCAVAAACASAAVGGKASGGFTLLQGPPGTGKTSVILHILNFLHLVQYQRYYERKLVELRSGGVPDSEPVFAAGAALDADTAGGGGASRRAGPEGRGSALADILKGIASSNKSSPAVAGEKVPRKPRILVCAPSNAAVDVLVERLLRDKLRDANGFYMPDMIRVGSPSACSERIRVVTLDHQVEEIMARGCSRLEEAKARYCVLLERREKLRGEAKGFQGDLPRGMDKAIIDVGAQIEAILRDVKRLQIVARLQKGETIDEVKDQLRAKLLDDAQIVFTTLNSSGQDFFARMAHGFRTVIIDEACQAVEASTLIPLLLDVRRCILVGDPKQLPATVISTSDTSAQYQRSLFERLMAQGHAVHLLDTQYRMHPAIRQFPSDYFYNGALKDGGRVAGISSETDRQIGVPARYCMSKC